MQLPDDATILRVQQYLINYGKKKYANQDMADLESDAGLAVIMAAMGWNKEGSPDETYLKIFGLRRMQDLYRQRWGRNDRLVTGVTQREAKMNLYYSLSLDHESGLYEQIPYEVFTDEHQQELHEMIRVIRDEDERIANILLLSSRGLNIKEISAQLNIHERTCSTLKTKGIKIAREIHASYQMKFV